MNSNMASKESMQLVRAEALEGLIEELGEAFE